MLSARSFFPLVILAVACGGSSTGAPPADADASVADASLPVNAQTPPTTGKADVEAWLATGEYKSWHCESAPHASRPPSPHGINRICSNDLTSSFTGTGERPVGTASVKELFDSTGKTVAGYAVYVKTQASSDDGASWYWYERSSSQVVADGFGNAGTAMSLCVGCHTRAASSATHLGASDFVWTEVK
jgi:hypothetical protein